MREVKAVIQPFVLDKVIDALEEVPGIPGITVSEVRGFGKSHEDGEAVRDVKKIKLEIMVPEDMVEDVVERLRAAAHTGNPGDGRIFVIGIQQVVDIRTGNRAPGSL
jgi:nitrogen regulatory protein P-II 1